MLDTVLESFTGFNVLRIFPYVDWPDTGWAAPPVDVARAFVEYVAARGFWTEVCLITNRHPDPRRYVQEWRDALQDLPGALLEGVNEPDVPTKTDPQEIRDVLSASRCPYTSGDAEQTPGGSAAVYGTYLVAHHPRDEEWVRKSKNLLEFYDGGGPFDPSDPPHRVPGISDEPKRPDQTGYNERDHYTHMAIASIMGAGGTFHYSGGKFGQPPDGNEARCRDAALRGLTVFPNDAPNSGGYGKIVESPTGETNRDAPGSDEHTLRSYIKGRYLVRVRPKTLRPAHGETIIEGWKSLDDWGVAFDRE